MSGGAMRCCVPSCPNHKPPSDASAVADDAEPRDADCRFFAVPTIGADDSVASDSGLRRALWLRRIKKCTIDFDPDTALLCNRHFVEGKPAGLEETGKIDWLPNMEMDSDDLCEEVDDIVLEGDDDDEEEEQDEEFIKYNKRQKEKVERLKRENVALKRKIQELGDGGIIQGMRLKMLKTMKVATDSEEEDEEPLEKIEQVDIKSEPMNGEEETSEVELPLAPETVQVQLDQQEKPPIKEEKPAQAKLQINNLKMKLSNILGTIK